jgi:hypothetical protein
LKILGCRNTKVRNFTIDCVPFAFTQGTILHVDASPTHFNVSARIAIEVDAGYPALLPADSRWIHAKVIFWDADTGRLVPDQGGVRFVSGVNATASWGLHEELSNDATTTTEHEGPSNDVKTSSEGDSLDSTTTTTSTGSNDGYSNPKSEGSSRTSTVRSSTAKIGQGRTPSVVMVTIRPHVTNATRWWPEVGQRVSIVPTSGVGAVYQRGGLGGVVVEDLTVHGSGNDAIHECVVVFHTSSSSSTHLSRLLLRAYTWLVVSQPSCTARVNRLSLILHLQHASFSPRTHTHALTPPPPHPPTTHTRTHHYQYRSPTRAC